MKTFRPLVESDFFLVIMVVWVAACSGCMRKPRQLPPSFSPYGEAQLVDEASGYVESYLHSPEMFPRELSMPARRELLRINWAMQNAIENGTLKVRLMAPPLMLTGDPNIDRSRTYEAVLVADDLKPGTNFLDVYEIRIGPIPELAVVRPAYSAKHLKEVDFILAEEELARLSFDQQSLRSGMNFVTNYLPILTNRLMLAKTAYSNDVAALDKMITEIDKRTGDTNALLAEISLRLAEIEGLSG